MVAPLVIAALVQSIATVSRTSSAPRGAAWASADSGDPVSIPMLVAVLAQPPATPLEPPPSAQVDGPTAAPEPEPEPAPAPAPVWPVETAPAPAQPVSPPPPAVVHSSRRDRRAGVELAVGSGVALAATATLLWSRQRRRALEMGVEATRHANEDRTCHEDPNCISDHGIGLLTPLARTRMAAFAGWPLLPTALSFGLAAGAGAVLAHAAPADATRAQRELIVGTVAVVAGSVPWLMVRYRKPPLSCVDLPSQPIEPIERCYARWFDVQAALYVASASFVAVGAGLLSHGRTSNRLRRLTPSVAADRKQAMLGLSLRF